MEEEKNTNEQSAEGVNPNPEAVASADSPTDVATTEAAVAEQEAATEPSIETATAEAPSEAAQPEEDPHHGRNLRKERVGEVTSNKMNKSITVSVQRRIMHPIYGKYIGKTTKFTAHDENNDCSIGDTVRIMETRPISKNKRWRLVEIIERAQ
jgi:small subunit ribosomal protein S17